MNTSQCTTQDNSIGFTLGATMAEGVNQGAGSLGGFVHRILRLPITVLEVLLTWQDPAHPVQLIALDGDTGEKKRTVLEIMD